MKKLFVMFLVAVMFISPAVSADDSEFTMDTRVVLSYDDFANTEFFTSHENGFMCFMLFMQWMDLYWNTKYFDESVNGYNISMSELYKLSDFVLQNVSHNRIPEDIINFEKESDTNSCKFLQAALPNSILPNSNKRISEISTELVFDVFSNAADKQSNKLSTETNTNHQTQNVTADPARIDANMNGDPDDIYDIVIQYTDMDASSVRSRMFLKIQKYIINRYCATDNVMFSCVPEPRLNCDLLPNTTYLERDLDLLCNNRNWGDYVIDDGVYELRLER